MNQYVYYPEGVCSHEYRFDIKNDTIEDVEIIGGCAGNLLGIRALIMNQQVTDIIQKLEGVACNQKPTSCPDQIAQALRAYLLEKEV